MKRKTYSLDDALNELGDTIGTGVLIYLEKHKELMSDPNFDCAHRIARNAFIKVNFDDISLDLVGNLYEQSVIYLLETTSDENIESYKNDAYFLAEVVQRYDMASRYHDIFADYN